MTEPESARPSLRGPLLLAVVSLVVIGASVGVIAGLAGRDDQVTGGAGSAGDQTPSAVAEVSPDTYPAPSSAAPSPPPEPSPAHPSSRPPVSPTAGCPAVTEQAARDAGASGTLSRVLYVHGRQVDRPGRSVEMWICRDRAGKLFYQGHEGGPTDRGFPATSGRSLFLSTVSAKDGGYEAVSGSGGNSTHYRAWCDRLEIAQVDRTERFTVISCER